MSQYQNYANLCFFELWLSIVKVVLFYCKTNVVIESNYVLLIATLLEVQYQSGEVNQNQCFCHPNFGLWGHIWQGANKLSDNFALLHKIGTGRNFHIKYVFSQVLALFDKWHPRACSEVCLCWSLQGQARFSKFFRWRLLVLIEP